MLKNTREGIEPVQDGSIGPLKQIEQLQQKGHPLAYTWAMSSELDPLVSPKPLPMDFAMKML